MEEVVIQVGDLRGRFRLFAQSRSPTRHLRLLGRREVAEDVLNQRGGLALAGPAGATFVSLRTPDEAQGLTARAIDAGLKAQYCDSLYDSFGFGKVANTEQELDRLKPFFVCWEEATNLSFNDGKHKALTKIPPQCTPSGIDLLPEFVSPQEEFELVQFFDSQPWSQKLRRRVQHYGYQFQYETLYIDARQNIAPPLPACITFLLARLEPIVGFRPDQLTVNEYEPGQGIGFHVDTHSAFNHAIIVVSLLSGLNMEFRKPSGASVEYFLSRRSLCVFAHEARYEWLHGIKSRKTDIIPEIETLNVRQRRISLTFRLLNWENAFHCNNCVAPELCDTRNPSSLKLPERL